MEISLAQLCASSPGEFSVLHEYIQRCAARGRSYEFPDCLLPPGCQPARTGLGFWQGRGAYWLYQRPAVEYRGESPTLAFFFRRGTLRFESFPALCQYLSALGRELPPQQPLLLQGIADALGEEVLGQPQAVAAVAQKLYGHIGKTQPQRPLSLILHGPTGVGKSRLARAVAPVLNRLCGAPRYHFACVELNTFTQPHTVSRLIGAPPGYAGYGDPPAFQAVEGHPRTVFLFDELDKAHPEVLKIFLSILDEGSLSGPASQLWDFRHCILLFTTNGDLSPQGSRPLGFSPPSPARQGLPRDQLAFAAGEEGRLALARSGVLREIAGRFGGIIGFSPLSLQARAAITARQMEALGREYGLEILPDPVLALALTPEEGFSVRSTAGYLEGLLTPHLLGRAPGRYTLTGTAQAIKLLPRSPEPGQQPSGPAPVTAGTGAGSRLSPGPSGKCSGRRR